MNWKNYFRILLVDDQDDILKKLVKRFRQMGFQDISLAKNGKEAVELIKRIVPDLTIVNRDMQVKDGYKTIKAIRENGFDCLIVTLTEKENGPGKDKLSERWSGNIIRKPINHDFEKQLFTILDSKGYIPTAQ